MSTLATHPGELLRDELAASSPSARAFAGEIGVPAPRVSDIVKCRRAVTPQTALRLARHFGGSPKVWLRLQADRDVAQAENARGAEIRRTLLRPRRAPAKAEATT